MKIALNTTSAVEGGGVTYIKNLLMYLSKINTNHQYLVLTTTAGKEVFYFQHPNFKFLSFRIPSKNSLLRLCWEQLFLPVLMKKENVDVLFSPGNICPLLTNIPNVIMIQNIEPFSNGVSKSQGLLQVIRLKLLKLLTTLSIRKAQRVILPSMKARIDIEKLGVSHKHSEVVYHGINREIFYPHPENTKLLQVKKKYGLDKFILCVSNIQRYKNFLELIKAFVLLKDKIGNDIQLVFAGRCFDREYYDEMKTFLASQGCEDQIVFLGNIPYDELPYLYSTCMVFAYPSTCESFGMTLVEAIACGAPVLASKAEPMPEICANAAIYFDPMDPFAIADVICKTLNDQEAISSLIKNAIERAKTFSWENTVIRTLKIFESIS